MSHSFQPLTPAKLSFTSSGVPYSEIYQDRYHSERGAIEQARHVFIAGNGLPGRWKGRSSFTVCETGFGLGRNFLALWRAWLDDSARSERLHVLSFEAHPFSRSDLAEALPLGLPRELRVLGDQLIKRWPPLLPGIHRLEFEGGRLTLTLAFGPVERMAFQAEACVDAFFLDGFAPSKNPQMWTPALFGQMVRLANQGATAASWCVAGQVRRDLSNAGFIVSKERGFGTKREMLVAALREGLGRPLVQNQLVQASAAAPIAARPMAAASDAALPTAAPPIVIVGGSIAAAGVAHALASRGQAVKVLDPSFRDSTATAHHGHVAAAVSPLISRDDDVRSRLVRAGVLRALHRWQQLPPHARPMVAGTLEVLTDDVKGAERQQDLAALCFPEEWVQWLSAEDVQRKTQRDLKRPALWFPMGQLVRPDLLIPALLDHPLIEREACRVDAIEPDLSGWVIRRQGAMPIKAGWLILANAADALRLMRQAGLAASLQGAAAMHRLAGQVSYVKAPMEFRTDCTVSGAGYWLPDVNGVSVAGSTYERGAEFSQVTDTGREVIFGKLGLLINATHEELASSLAVEGGWAGWRAVVPGRLPLAGPVKAAPGLWLACAYGSRGFTWSSLVGDMIGAALFSEPQIIERDLIQAIAPR